MSPELIVAVLGIPTAGLVSYIVGRRKERASAADRRRVIATGLLAELQSLEIGLRKLANHSQAARSTIWPDDSTFKALRGDLFLFRRSAAGALIVFYGLVNEINSSRMRMRDECVELTDRAHRFIRVKATFAANHIPELRTLLEAAGGSPLAHGSTTWVSDGVEPTLMPPAFESNKQLPSS